VQGWPQRVLKPELDAMIRSPHAKPAVRARRLDRLVRHMVVNWALGALAGVVCASALLIVDPFGLRPLIWRSDAAIAALLLLYFGFMTTFGGLVCAAAVMAPPKDDDPPARRATRQRDAPRACARAARF
jgi:hypothetical protein